MKFCLHLFLLISKLFDIIKSGVDLEINPQIYVNLIISIFVSIHTKKLAKYKYKYFVKSIICCSINLKD